MTEETTAQSPVLSQTSEDSSEKSDTNVAPKRHRSLINLYENTEEVELDQELLFLGIEEPVTYNQAKKERAWKDAMKSETKAIEGNNT